MSIELRPGEESVTCCGGNCSVCKKPIDAGIAIQLSKWSSRIRHTGCIPKKDSRYRRNGSLAKGIRTVF